MSDAQQIIMRKDAEAKILTHWASTIETAKSVDLPIFLPRFDRLRNYEFEMLLQRLFGGEWAIGELCPFDGKYCVWGDIVAKEEESGT